MTHLSRGLRGLVLVLTCALVLGGCGFSVYDAPLPGGTDVGEDPIQVKAEFADVLDLVPQSSVKVNDVSVGKITDIALDGETAVVTMELPNDIELPANPVAEIRQTSLLGEKFISLSPPESGASQATLADGARIPLDATGRNPEVEEVLGALSLVLNGGGVAQLKTIAHELNLALEGREDSAKSVFRQIRSLMTQLDDNKGDIVAAIEGLNRLSITANDQIGTIDAALEELPSALDTLDKQRTDLVRMLKSLNRLGDVGVRVIRTSKQATIDTFKQLVPVLTQLSDAGDAFVNSFHVFLTYPFVDEVVGRDPQVARNLHMGDYTNLSIQLDVSLTGNDSVNPPGGLPDTDEVCTTLADVRDQLPNRELPLDQLIQLLENVEDLCDGAQQAINECLAKKNPNKLANCLENRVGATIENVTDGVVDALCDLASQLPVCNPSGGGGGGGDGGGLDLPDLPDLPGLGRAGFGPETDPVAGRGPTVRQLMSHYDPALVSLLVPGMVTR